MRLSIVIPALNEEDGIESIIQRSLAARSHICKHSGVKEVDITVVSDGSTDRTVEIASKYREQIRLIVFPKNRGYGAAIKEGWTQAGGDILGFLDADGTCDPEFFAQLCRRLEESNADVVLGCRLNSNSEMPLIRRIGNHIFAVLLTLFSNSRVRDTASGMRVVKRSSLNNLFPLPDGLHFTPAMSARAMLSEVLRIEEVDMPYRERVGDSKLRVIKDGLRFLRVICETALLYRPWRLLGFAATICLLLALVFMAQPVVFYFTNHVVLDWMIYRFLLSCLLGITATLCYSASYITQRMVNVALVNESSPVTRPHWFFSGNWAFLAATILILGGLALVSESLLDRVRSGTTTEHWSRYVVMTFCFAVSIILIITKTIGFVFELVEKRVQYWSGFSR